MRRIAMSVMRLVDQYGNGADRRCPSESLVERTEVSRTACPNRILGGQRLEFARRRPGSSDSMSVGTKATMLITARWRRIKQKTPA